MPAPRVGRSGVAVHPQILLTREVPDLFEEGDNRAVKQGVRVYEGHRTRDVGLQLVVQGGTDPTPPVLRRDGEKYDPAEVSSSVA